jgi:hypothetical protein
MRSASVRAARPVAEPPGRHEQARLLPLLIAGHGVLAVTTMIVVLLAALGSAAG